MGKSTPRSVKRLRMLYVQMLRDHQSGKEHLTPTLLLKVSDHIGVLDGYYPKEILVLSRRYLDKTESTVEELEYDPEVKKLRDELEKRRGDGNSDGNGSASPTV